MVATGRTQWRLAAAALLAVLAGGTGCIGGRDQPAASPTGSPPASTTPRTEPPGVPAEFPAEPQEYAELTVAAWAAPDLLRLADLATPEVRREIVELPGPPDLTWRFIRCEEDGDHTDCGFSNLAGDRLVLTIDHRRLGEPRAAVGMAYQVTPYPEDPLRYVRAFIAAWQDGNQARMENLAAPGVVEVFAQLVPPAEPAYQVGDPAGPLVEVVVSLGAEGEVRTAVSAGLLGEPRAIRTATLEPASG